MSGSNGGYSEAFLPAPRHANKVGIILSSHATQGSLLVDISLVPEIYELHDVQNTATSSDGNVLVYDSTNAVWSGSDTRNFSISSSGLVSATSISISTTGSFGRIEATTISASRVDVDATTITVGGSEITKTLVDNITGSYSTSLPANTAISSSGTGSFGYVSSTGHITASSFSGDGSGLTGIVALGTLSSSAQIASDISGS